MKKTYGILLILASLMVFKAQAEEAVQTVTKNESQSGQTPLIVRVDKPRFSFDDFQIKPDNFPNGIYVMAMKKPLFRDPVYFPKVGSIVTEKLKNLGFKIASSPETADAVLTFNGSSELKFEEIEKGETDRVSRGLTIADNLMGAALGGKLMGNTYVLVNGVTLNLDNKNVAIEIKIKGVKDESLNKHSALTMYAQYNEDTYVTSEKLVGLLVDEWAKKCVTGAAATNSTASAQPEIESGKPMEAK